MSFRPPSVLKPKTTLFLDAWRSTNQPHCDITVAIFNALGQEIQQLPLQNNRVEFIRRNVESGLYFYSITDKNKQLIISGMMAIQNE